MESVPQQQQRPESILRRGDEGHVFCFKCDYDLTFSESGRCPECGTPFDRSELVEWAHASEARFDRLKGHLGTGPGMPIWWAALWHPSRVGREMPVSVDPASARRIGIACRLLTTAIIFLIGVAHAVMTEVLSLAIATAAALAAGVSSIVCESTINATVNRHVRWRYDPAGRYAVAPQPFSGFSAVFLPLHASAVSVVILLDTIAQRGIIPSVAWASLGVMAWWCYSLGRAMLAPARPTGGLLLSIFFIPMIAAVPVIPGWMLAVLSLVPVAGASQG